MLLKKKERGGESSTAPALIWHGQEKQAGAAVAVTVTAIWSHQLLYDLLGLWGLLARWNDGVKLIAQMVDKIK